MFLTDNFDRITRAALDFVVANLSWFYLIVTILFLGFVIFLAFSRYGKIKLGKEDEEPEFGLFSWFAMLFQAGMGIGVIFWGVSEPVMHYATQPPYGGPRRTRLRLPNCSCSIRSSTGGCTPGRSTLSSPSLSRTSTSARTNRGL